MKFFLALLLTSLPVLGAADIADSIEKQLSPFEILRGNFEQTKTIKFITRPLKSSGIFVLLKGKGVLWETLKPQGIAGTLRVTQDGIEQIRDGKVRFQMKTEQEPSLKLINQVLFAVFSADLSGLKEHFEMKGSIDAGHWEVVLSPKEAWMAKVAKEINLQGGKNLESLQISEGNGDQTSIRFSGIDLNSTLRSAEKALFE
jgi:hypothetical protein